MSSELYIIMSQQYYCHIFQVEIKFENYCISLNFSEQISTQLNNLL